MKQDSEINSENPNPNSETLGWGSEFVRDEPSAKKDSELMDWLAQHPEESARLHDLQNLVRLYQQSGPPAPSESTWSELRAGVMAEMSTSAPRINPLSAETVIPKAHFPQRWLRSGFLGAAAAAAIILALVLRQDNNPNAAPVGPNANLEARPDRQNSDDLFALGQMSIIDSNDVDLVSMEGKDYSLLVVGNPPVSEALILMKAGDVTGVTIDDKDPDVKVHLATDPDSSPMIVVPIRSKESKDPDSK